MSRLPALLSLSLVAIGCPPPSSRDPYALTSAGMKGSSGGEEGSSGDELGSSGSTGSPEPTGTGEIDESTGPSSTTDEPPPMVGPPRVVEAWWSPGELTTPDIVTLTIETRDVEWLHVTYDGAPIELEQSELEPWMYSTKAEISSELFEGTHTAVIRPFRGQEEGETVVVDFVADLPTHGSEGFWEASAALGKALGSTVLPGIKDDVYEFGTLAPGGQQRCYLRRRRADGLAPVKDVVELQPGKPCTATDAAIDPDGRLLLLYEYESAGITQWQLDRHDPWNQTLEPVLVGAQGQKANAVAVGPNGEIVACGSRPGGPNDTDLAGWIGGIQNPITLDLVYEQEHAISEVAHDCAFVGSTLVFAGDAAGQHGDENASHTRHTVVEVDLITREALWSVAPPAGNLLDGSARAIAASGDDRYVVAGHLCAKPCVPQLEHREYALGGVVLSSFRPTMKGKATEPTGIAWHPAGYAVVSAGEIVSPAEMKFWVQGWIPGQQQDLWTYRRSDGEGIHWALDVAVGHPYWIYLVGVVDFGGPLPVFTILFP